MSARIEQVIIIVTANLSFIGCREDHGGDSTDNFLSESISFGAQRRDVEVFLFANGWGFHFPVLVWHWLHCAFV